METAVGTHSFSAVTQTHEAHYAASTELLKVHDYVSPAVNHKITFNTGIRIQSGTLKFGTGRFAGSRLLQNRAMRDLGSRMMTGVGSL